MTLFKDKFKANSNRLQNWDYSSEAVYFITITTENRKCIFGSVIEDKMILNDVGQIVEKELLKSIKIRKNWFFHNWIVMPNHIHLLIEIMESQDSQQQIVDKQITHTQIVETHSSASTSGTSTNIVSNVAETHSSAPLQIRDVNKNMNQNPEQNTNQLQSKLSRKSNSISSFVTVFKSVTTKQINDLYKEKQSINIKNVDKQIFDTQIGDMHIPPTHIVETHSSASTSGISTKIVSNVAETHCCAPLQLHDVNKTENQNENKTVNELQSISSNKKIWQTNYHDHIVRNYKRFETIYNYIKANPRSWETDSINSKFQ